MQSLASCPSLLTVSHTALFAYRLYGFKVPDLPCDEGNIKAFGKDTSLLAKVRTIFSRLLRMRTRRLLTAMASIYFSDL